MGWAKEDNPQTVLTIIDLLLNEIKDAKELIEEWIKTKDKS